jgi:hypothetical protein
MAFPHQCDIGELRRACANAPLAKRKPVLPRTSKNSVKEPQYHATEQLMRIYRSVSWSVSSRAGVYTDKCLSKLDKDAETALFYFSEFAPVDIRGEFEARICELFKSRWMLEIVNDSLVRIRSYPNYGKQYYDILFFRYVDESANSENDILAYTGLERSEYYRKRKEALRLMSSVIWGMAIPQVQRILKQVV